MSAQVASSGSVPSCPVCPVCCRTIAVTAAGLLRQHGPVSARCPGSRQPPAAPIDVSSQPANSPPSYSASSGHEANSDDKAATPHTPYSLPLPPKALRIILKCLPKASRGLAGKNSPPSWMLSLAGMTTLRGTASSASTLAVSGTLAGEVIAGLWPLLSKHS